MSKELELLQKALEWMEELKYAWANVRDSGDYDLLELIADINKIEKLLLAQPEPEQEVYAKGYAEAMRQQVYEAFEAGRKSALSNVWNKERDAMSEAWNIAQPETKQAPDYYLWHDEVHEQHPTNEGDPDVYPLYLAPQKTEQEQTEPLSDEHLVSSAPELLEALENWINALMKCRDDANKAIEKAHGIGVDDDN